ncbi:MAG: segregation/condensation protein A [Cyanobium sp.]|nr:segregation/condensation protein A [Cyanobium sp.]
MSQGGARLAIRLLQDAAERGELDPWDVDVIAVVDGFLDQLQQRINLPRLTAVGGSYEQDLSETSEAFLAAAVLVGLKAELLESSTLVAEQHEPEEFGFEADDDPAGWSGEEGLTLPRRPERRLLRRPVAPPPLQRPVTLGELIRQLEDIAAQLEQADQQGRRRHRPKRLSERAAIEQVANLAHREKLPETTAALSRFLREWPPAGDWVPFDTLVNAWASCVQQGAGTDSLDCDRVGVFWALLFLCHQGSLELEQRNGLFGPLSLRRPAPQTGREAGEHAVTALPAAPGSAALPAVPQLAA